MKKWVLGLSTGLLAVLVVFFRSLQPSVSSSMPNENTRQQTPAQTAAGRRSGDDFPKSPAEVTHAAIHPNTLAKPERTMAELLAGWVGRDALGAARYAESLSPENGREDALRQVARFWAALDPTGASAWADRLANADERRVALADVLGKIAERNPAEAVRKAGQFNIGDRGAIVANLAQQWASADMASAVTWATSQPPGMEREQALERIAFVLSQRDPSAAARLASSEIPAGPVQLETLMAVLHQWAARDYNAAIAWVATSPRGLQVDRALDELAGITDKR